MDGMGKDPAVSQERDESYNPNSGNGIVNPQSYSPEI